MALLVAACDPCTGVGSCVAPQLRYEGVLTRKFGYPAGGPAEAVTVKFVRTGGVQLESDTLVATSDAKGRFLIEGRATREGQVIGDLVIMPPGPIEPIRERGLQLATTRAPGEVLRLREREIPYPYFSYSVALHFRATGQPAAGVEAVFRRTGGIRLNSDTLRLTADPRGFLLIRPTTLEHGIVTGELTVYPPPPYKPIVLPDLRLRTAVTEHADSVIRVGIGSRLPYMVQFLWADTDEGVEGLEIEFVRTGGVPISPATYRAVTDRFGSVAIEPAPLASGQVVGDLHVRPPAPGRAFTVPGLRLSTVEDDRPRIYLRFWKVESEEGGADG